MDNKCSQTDSINNSCEQSPVCPVCKSYEVEQLCSVDGYAVWRCPESATDFVWPMPSDSALKELYDREAWFEGGEKGGYTNYDEQTKPSLDFIKGILDEFSGEGRTLSILDIGCGYGNHLALAAEKNWQCYGVEPSAHARQIAVDRYGDRMSVVPRVEDLVPRRFDLILMLEVIEHLKDPYKLFFTLFGRNAIGPETRIVITTPNARSFAAIEDPSGWPYRHPPSHLVFYSAQSLKQLLQRLMFKNIHVRGIVQQPEKTLCHYPDEHDELNQESGNFLGVMADASGSVFSEFMNERYLPGSYWKITEYEHLPRYSLASEYTRDAKVLDFGCGTGYGSAYLAKTAKQVIGLDISDQAINWARQTHRNKKLEYICRDDLGEGLDKQQFDLVTCFEMIEHVDHETQKNTIKSISKLLKPGGKLIISTPDPVFTAQYGYNPYHIREMNEAEFVELLKAEFEHVVILKQWIRPSVLIGKSSCPDKDAPVTFNAIGDDFSNDSLVAYVAICSSAPFECPDNYCQFDLSADFSFRTFETETKLNALRFENMGLLDRAVSAERRSSAYEEKAAYYEGLYAGIKVDQAETLAAKNWLDGQLKSYQEHASNLESQLQALAQNLQQSRVWEQELATGKKWLEEKYLEMSATISDLSATISDMSEKQRQLNDELDMINNNNYVVIAKKLGLIKSQKG